MTLIAMAVYDLEGSGRTELTKKTLECIAETVNFNRHRLFLIDNNSCLATKHVLEQYKSVATIITMPENVGTARAINKGWVNRQPGEYCIKMDNDVIIHSKDWVDQMEEVMKFNAHIGVLGLKRKDLIETPWNEDTNWRSTLALVPLFFSANANFSCEHLNKTGFPFPEVGRWALVEYVKGLMGTCTMFSPKLLDKIGFMWQPTVYGYDDSLVSVRSIKAGFLNAFLPHIEMDHIDPGGTFYQDWKEKHSGPVMDQASQIAEMYRKGIRPIYEAPQ